MIVNLYCVNALHWFELSESKSSRLAKRSDKLAIEAANLIKAKVMTSKVMMIITNATNTVLSSNERMEDFFESWLLIRIPLLLISPFWVEPVKDLSENMEFCTFFWSLWFLWIQKKKKKMPILQNMNFEKMWILWIWKIVHE